MKAIAQSGATVEEAIMKALHQLQAQREDVHVEIVQEGRKGFLGFGAKEAKVYVTVKEREVEPSKKLEEEVDVVTSAPQAEERAIVVETEEVPTERELSIEQPLQHAEREEAPSMNVIDETTRYIQEIANELGCEQVDVTIEIDGKYVNIQIESPDAALLIGKRGQNLNALQQLTQLVVNRYSEKFKVVRMNVGDYRERRERSLITLAERSADQAVRQQRKVKLNPMPAYERKVVHQALVARVDVDTYSEGRDPHRYLVIEPLE